MVEIVVVDMDPGIDDIYGLILLVNANNVGLITVAAIICSIGNTIVLNTCKNTIRILEVMGRTDISVYQGVNNSIIAPQYFDDFFGRDGFGDIEGIWEPNMNLLKRENAAEMLHTLTNTHPGRVSLVSLGPLTFTAIALIQYDDLPLKDIWIMGGNSTEFDSPEFNFRKDPEAVYSVLKRTNVPAYIFTFDACTALSTTLGWRINTLGNINNKIMALMNAAEAFRIHTSDEKELWKQCDAITVAVMIHDKIDLTQSQYCGTATLSNIDAYNDGGFLLLNSSCQNKNVILVQNVNSNDFQDILYWAVSNF